MLALSQSVTEQLLEQGFEAAGGKVERGMKLAECRNAGEGVEAVLESSDDGHREAVGCPWLLAADGAHSAARQQVGVDFEGSSFAEEWHLADAPLRTALTPDHVYGYSL